MELCQTPLSQPSGSQVNSQSYSHSQSQAFPSSQSQSIGELKLQKLQRSHSLLSAHSLFLDGEEESEVEEEGEEREVEDLDCPGNSGDKDALEGRDIEGMEVDSGDDLFIAMETELDSRKCSSPVVKITSESEQQQQEEQVTPPKPTHARSKLTLDFQRSEKGRGGRRRTPVSPFQSPKPPRLRYKAEEMDEESELELPITTPLASPIPLSPKSKEMQSDILKELDSFNSSCDEVGRELEQLGGLTDSQFGVPYSQLQTPSSQYSKSHPELDKVWNSTAAATVARESPLDTHSPLKLGGGEPGGGGGRQLGLGQSVQLEYDMPEITASQLEASSEPLFIAPLETDSPRSSLTKGHQASTTSSLRKAKRQLLRKPAAGSSGKAVSPKSSATSRTRGKRKRRDRDIPQLDGADDKPLSSLSSTRGKASSRKRKRTLGIRRKQRKSSKQPVEEAQLLREEKAGSASTEVKQQPSMPEATVEEMVTGSDTQEREEDPPSSAAALPWNEGTGPVLHEEGDTLCGGSVQRGLVETEVWESGQGSSCEVSSDASGQQSTREKAKLSLSLKKSANRSHRTRESDPDLVIAETVVNPSWGAEGESLLRGSEIAMSLSSPDRTREGATHPEVVSSPSLRLSQHLKEQALRRGPILKLDKLPTKKLTVQMKMKENTAASLTKDTGEQHRKKPGSKRSKMSATSLSSGGSEADSTNEREKRYKKRCQKRSTRNRWSPKFLMGMSYEQQLKRAIEMSKQTHIAESAQQQLLSDAESGEPLQLPDIGQEGGSDGLEWEEPGEQHDLGSPLMFSPSSLDDADRTVVEESPPGEERGLDDRILDKICPDEGIEKEEAAAVGEGVGEWNLDMSISSISESPPYTSSPALAAEGGRESERKEGEKYKGEEEEEELLHDSTLKLELETSFMELPSPPPQSSSPMSAATKPPFDADASFFSEDGFPCVILASETAAKEETDDTNQGSLTTPSDPTAKVTVEGDKDDTQPTTPSKSTTELEAAADPNQPPLLSDYPAVASVIHSPEGCESSSEADQVLTSQMDVMVSSEEDFHLSVGSCSSSSEDEMNGGRGSPDPLNFSTEKTSRVVRFEQCMYNMSPNKSEYQAMDDGDRRPHSSQVETGEAAASNVIVLGGHGGSELAPPTQRELAESAVFYSLPTMRHQEPFYSCPADVQRPL